MRIISLLFTALMLALGGCGGPRDDAKGPVILAAASLQEAMEAAANAWAAQGHPRPVLSFAASSALARQIEAGASADLFISADAEWMDTVEGAGLTAPGTRADLVSNSLVLIAPQGSAIVLDITPGFDLAQTLGPGRLAMANPDAVPAGRYGKEALQTLGAWSAVSRKVASGDNVRVALGLVSRGEAPLGIVYATDAMAEPRVRVVGTFPESSHAPITYPAAVLQASNSADARPFLAFLQSRRGKAIFKSFGFRVER